MVKDLRKEDLSWPPVQATIKQSRLTGKDVYGDEPIARSMRMGPGRLQAVGKHVVLVTVMDYSVAWPR